MPKRAPFIWQEVEHWTLWDIMDTLMLIDDQDEADDFIESYAKVCVSDEHALHNVGYIAEIIACDSDNDEAEQDAERICKLFDVERRIDPVQVFKDSSLGVKSDTSTPTELPKIEA